MRNLSEEAAKRGESAAPRTIVFVNHRESAERVAQYLKSKGVDVALYHGALDQRGREQALAAFNNGSAPVLVATDLAARGLDIEGVRNIIHYHQPLTPETYTHRNGRTARVDEEGDIFLLLGPDEEVKPYVDIDREYHLDTEASAPLKGETATLVFNAGRKEKLSKGDIAGFLIKEGGLDPDRLGKIQLFDHYALAAVKRPLDAALLKRLNDTKVKGTKRKITLLQ